MGLLKTYGFKIGSGYSTFYEVKAEDQKEAWVIFIMRYGIVIPTNYSVQCIGETHFSKELATGETGVDWMYLKDKSYLRMDNSILTEEFVIENADIIDIKRYTEEFIKKGFSLDFFERFEDSVDWRAISISYDLSEEDIRRFEHLLHWDMLCYHKRLSYELLEDFIDRLDWYGLVANKDRISSEFVDKYTDKIDETIKDMNTEKPPF